MKFDVHLPPFYTLHRSRHHMQAKPSNHGRASEMWPVSDICWLLQRRKKINGMICVSCQLRSNLIFRKSDDPTPHPPVVMWLNWAESICWWRPWDVVPCSGVLACKWTLSPHWLWYSCNQSQISAVWLLLRLLGYWWHRKTMSKYADYELALK